MRLVFEVIGTNGPQCNGASESAHLMQHERLAHDVEHGNVAQKWIDGVVVEQVERVVVAGQLVNPPVQALRCLVVLHLQGKSAAHPRIMCATSLRAAKAAPARRASSSTCVRVGRMASCC